MGFSSGRSTRAKRQGKQVLYDAKEVTETRCTRLLILLDVFSMEF